MLLSRFMQVCPPSSSRAYCLFMKTTNRSCWVGRSPVKWTIDTLRGCPWRTAAKYNRHVITKVHNSFMNLTWLLLDFTLANIRQFHWSSGNLPAAIAGYELSLCTTSHFSMNWSTPWFFQPPTPQEKHFRINFGTHHLRKSLYGNIDVDFVKNDGQCQ